MNDLLNGQEPLKTIISDRGVVAASAHFGPRDGFDGFKLGKSSGVLCLSTGVEDYCQDLLRQSTEARSREESSRQSVG
jgi:hypothetical protein